MARQTTAQAELKYLDMQAYVGITKHNGGFAATDELLSLCHIEDAREALNVGCGIGVGSAYVAKKHNCRVVGVDISDKMLAWSRLRAREERVEDRVEFRLADVLDLPFEADRFDVVFCESVIAFVEDKRRAIRELVRVAKPGGYVGLNESLWFQEPSPELAARVRASTGADIPLPATWQALWEESGLRDRVVRLYPLDYRAEIKSRLQWVGRRWALRGFVRLARLYLTNSAIRQSLKEQFGSGLQMEHAGYGQMEHAGYGLFAGRK